MVMVGQDRPNVGRYGCKRGRRSGLAKVVGGKTKRLAVAIMHAADLDVVAASAILDAVVVAFVQGRQGCEPRAREPGERAEEEAVNAAAEYADEEQGSEPGDGGHYERWHRCGAQVSGPPVEVDIDMYCTLGTRQGGRRRSGRVAQSQLQSPHTTFGKDMKSLSVF
jgi:hypothetical protein